MFYIVYELRNCFNGNVLDSFLSGFKFDTYEKAEKHAILTVAEWNKDTAQMEGFYYKIGQTPKN